MFEGFTESARRVIVFAQEEARRLNHDYISTEHLLLGVIREHNGVGARALDSFDVSLSAVCRQVIQIVGRGPGEPGSHIPLTPHAKKVLEFSARESSHGDQNAISTGLLLLGLIREDEGVAAEVLARFDVNLGTVRQKMAQILKDDARD